MFGWLLKFFKGRKKASPYVQKKETVSTTPTSSPKPQNVYRQTPSTTPTRTSNGYRKSPYSKDFQKPEKKEYNYKPINTTFDNSSKPTPQVTSTPTIIPAPKLSGTVNFYETAQAVNNFVRTDEIVESNVEDSPVVVEPEQTNIDYVLPKDGHVFVMNGYGVLIEVDGNKVEAYLDMGVDINFLPGQKVELHHWQGPYDQKVGTFISELNKEREGKPEEILVQKIFDV